MASKGGDSRGGGCAALVAIVVAFAIVMWMLSGIGHALGLTPTYHDVFDRPGGWVGRHYRGVVWGYLLTIAALAIVPLLVWLAVHTRSPDARQAVLARERLVHATALALLVTVTIVALPIGRRPGVDASSPAKDGNVPNVVGLSAARAEGRLGAANLIASFDVMPYDEHRCRVVAQDPPAGAELDAFGTVAVRCRTQIPLVVDMKAERAQLRLSDAGFDVRYANEPADYDLTRCRVLRQSRTGATVPNATIGLRLRCARPKPPPAGAAPSSCDPNYADACLSPDSPDYDCAGGSGDGPDFTGPVTVVGDDHYGLDSDGDGSACE